MADLLHGPLNKSLYSHTLELVTKILLYSPEGITFRYENTGALGISKNELHGQ